MKLKGQKYSFIFVNCSFSLKLRLRYSKNFEKVSQKIKKREMQMYTQ